LEPDFFFCLTKGLPNPLTLAGRLIRTALSEEAPEFLGLLPVDGFSLEDFQDG
jgi:hypothetical protein